MRFPLLQEETILFAASVESIELSALLRDMMKPVLFLTAMTASVLSAQDHTMTISPALPSPGSLVTLTITDPTGAADAIYGEMAGEQLHFHHGADGRWRAIGPVPVDAKGKVTAWAVAGSAPDTLRAFITLPEPKPSTGRGGGKVLSVSPRFTQPLSDETEARIERENATAREIGRKAHETQRMWTQPFMRPRTSIVTSRFGSGRMFNGTLSARHLGVDFRGKPGESVRAANRGVVALVDNFFLAGNVIYIDHGDGVVTAYFHLSKTLVQKGDTVSRGQEIGLVGATGRVTGPHLHWSARFGATTVNPLDLIAVTAR
jgi:murein DD-endopeptidase MepM/ murein hydrolase activator NlpD